MLKRLFGKKFVVIIAVLTIFVMVAPAFAADKLPQKMGKKLGRGILNTLTGLLEVPRNIYQTSKESNIVLGLTMGTAKGIGMAVVRTGAGIYDAVTFPLPIPGGYEPVLEPELVFSPDKESAPAATTTTAPAPAAPEKK